MDSRPRKRIRAERSLEHTSSSSEGSDSDSTSNDSGSGDDDDEVPQNEGLKNNSEHESNSQSAHQRSPSVQLSDMDKDLSDALEEPASTPCQEDESDAYNSDSGADFDAMHFDFELNDKETTPTEPSDNDESDSRSPSPVEPLLEHIALTKKFIEAISDAKLESSGLDGKVLEVLLNPTDKDPLDLLDAGTRFSIDLYMACRGVSHRVYEDARTVVMRRVPEVELLSHYLVKKVVAEVTGIVAHKDDMCINSCLAFTGPFSSDDHCSICMEARYESDTNSPGTCKPQKQMSTFLLGPQIQALRCNSSSALAMQYRQQRTDEIMVDLDNITESQESDAASDFVYDDLFCGSDYIELAREQKITVEDTVLSFSIDGAQLYQNKKSDTATKPNQHRR